MKILTRSSLTVLFIPFAASAATLQTHKIVPEKELLITDVAVVDSPLASYPGPFSFGHLMEKMAGKNDPSEFLKRWLVSWEIDHKINTHPLPSRKNIRQLLIDPWKEKDGYADASDYAWVVNWNNAPFRLLAILNRSDLGDPVAPPTRPSTGRPAYYGGPAPDSAAGEGRFVFAALAPDGKPLPGDFTIILEYRLKGEGGEPKDIVRWARDWHALGAYTEFGGGYLNHLATLTNRFTSGAFPPLPPGSVETSSSRSSRSTTSAIRQIRTSEASFDPVREFREFGLDNEGFLTPKTLAGTPATRFACFRVRTIDNDAFADLINENSRAIKSGSFRFPASLTLSNGQKAPFLAAHALIPPGGGKDFYWDARFIRDVEARRVLSFNTCNGCHAAETGTDSCLHIHPRLAGEPSKLSKFLQIGSSYKVSSPGFQGRGVKLAEMDRRIEFFETVLNPELPEEDIRAVILEPHLPENIGKRR